MAKKSIKIKIRKPLYKISQTNVQEENHREKLIIEISE